MQRKTIKLNRKRHHRICFGAHPTQGFAPSMTCNGIEKPLAREVTRSCVGDGMQPPECVRLTDDTEKELSSLTRPSNFQVQPHFIEGRDWRLILPSGNLRGPCCLPDRQQDMVKLFLNLLFRLERSFISCQSIVVEKTLTISIISSTVWNLMSPQTSARNCCVTRDSHSS